MKKVEIGWIRIRTDLCKEYLKLLDDEISREVADNVQPKLFNRGPFWDVTKQAQEFIMDLGYKRL